MQQKAAKMWKSRVDKRHRKWHQRIIPKTFRSHTHWLQQQQAIFGWRRTKSSWNMYSDNCGIDSTKPSSLDSLLPSSPPDVRGSFFTSIGKRFFPFFYLTFKLYYIG